MNQFISIAIKFTLICLFSVMFPYASIICLIANVAKIREIRRSLEYTRRFMPELTLGIGQSLTGVLETISNLAIFLSVFIAYYGSDGYK